MSLRQNGCRSALNSQCSGPNTVRPMANHTTRKTSVGTTLVRYEGCCKGRSRNGDNYRAPVYCSPHFFKRQYDHQAALPSLAPVPNSGDPGTGSGDYEPGAAPSPAPPPARGGGGAALPSKTERGAES